MTVELDREAAPISGRLYDEGGHERRFSGWLGLLTVLEALTDGTSGDVTWPCEEAGGST